MPLLAPPAIASGSLSRIQQPTLTVGQGVILRPWKDEDAPAVLAAYEDPAIQRWHVRRGESVDEVLGWIAGWRSGWDTECEAQWALAQGETDKLLGRMSLKHINMRDGSADIAYWMTPAARGRGLCSHAVAVLSEWAFEELGLHRIQLEHSVVNEPSCRVATKAGFRVEGIRRGSALHADGWHDMHVHSRLRTDSAISSP